MACRKHEWVQLENSEWGWCRCCGTVEWFSSPGIYLTCSLILEVGTNASPDPSRRRPEERWGGSSSRAHQTEEASPASSRRRDTETGDEGGPV